MKKPQTLLDFQLPPLSEIIRPRSKIDFFSREHLLGKEKIFPDTAVYWLAVILEDVEKPEFISYRLVILKYKDIRNANLAGFTLTASGFQTVQMVELPEASIMLALVTTNFVAAPKSNACYNVIKSSVGKVKKTGTASLSQHLRNKPTHLMEKMNYGKNYNINKK